MATASTVTIATVVESLFNTSAFAYKGSLTGMSFLLVISTLATPAKSGAALAALNGKEPTMAMIAIISPERKAPARATLAGASRSDLFLSCGDNTDERLNEPEHLVFIG